MVPITCLQPTALQLSLEHADATRGCVHLRPLYARFATLALQPRSQPRHLAAAMMRCIQMRRHRLVQSCCLGFCSCLSTTVPLTQAVTNLGSAHA
jgi:hypothetical protein